MLIRIVSAMFLIALLTGSGSINGLAESIRDKSCENELAAGGGRDPGSPAYNAKMRECLARQVVRVAEQSKGTRPEAKGKAPGAQPTIGEGCKSSLMTLVEGGVAMAKGCLVGQNQWRFWCADGSILSDGHPCTRSVATVQAAEGDGCKSALMPLIENGVSWGKGCSIGTSQWRFWCSNGRVYDETQPDPPPPGGIGKLCNPASKDSAAASPQAQPARQSEAFTAAPDQNALSQCTQQILSRNQCGAFLIVKDIRQLTKRGQGNDAVLVAEVDMETIQEFEVRSDTATNCTGTWWKEDPQYTRHQLSFPESKYFVRVGQLLTLRKTFTFQKNDFGWRCQMQTMKPVEDAVLVNRPQ
jgi:hypothetical protein